MKASRSVATRAQLLTKSGFSNYDVCLNPYVGCEFGCSYCYVRFFVKDPDKEWGEFVRVRAHLQERLPKELHRGYVKLNKSITLPIPQLRLVIGTMTDPYQPAEKRFAITHTALEILTDSQYPAFCKVGIFTRSPLVLRDLELIRKLPRGRVHFTVTPFPSAVMRKLEPYSPLTVRRWEVIAALKAAGIRTHVNVAPVMPGISESFIDEFAERLAVLGVDEYFVDPMQPYKESFAAFKEACQQLPAGTLTLSWAEIEATMLDRHRYLDWKQAFRVRWDAARARVQHLAPQQLPIWSDHELKTWVDLRTGESMSRRDYGDG